MLMLESIQLFVVKKSFHCAVLICSAITSFDMKSNDKNIF